MINLKSFLRKFFEFFLLPIFHKIILSINRNCYVKPLVRYGSKNDGGYVVYPGEYDLLLSFGVADDANFEFDMKKNNLNLKLFCYDPSINEMPITIKDSEFHKKGVAGFSSGIYYTLSDIISQIGCLDINNKSFLKMDIEGFEWDCLKTEFNTIKKFNQLVIEFHLYENISKNPFKFIYELLTRLKILKKLKNQFVIINSHANNVCPSIKFLNFRLPLVFELTYLNKNIFKNDLNKPNDPSLHDFQFLNYDS
jgi:hypothetical protein